MKLVLVLYKHARKLYIHRPNICAEIKRRIRENAELKGAYLDYNLDVFLMFVSMSAKEPKPHNRLPYDVEFKVHIALQ